MLEITARPPPPIPTQILGETAISSTVIPKTLSNRAPKQQGQKQSAGIRRPQHFVCLKKLVLWLGSLLADPI